MDIKDFYLNNNLKRPEYMMIHPTSHHGTQYNLTPIIHNNHIYVKINKGMYGLPQAGRIANDELVPYLDQHGYRQSEHTPGLFRHDTRPILFSLVVDDFGV
jgi:Reverse transcriptase (RNA-dependent DNA polymerase)